jgi:hypothetical protein
MKNSLYIRLLKKPQLISLSIIMYWEQSKINLFRSLNEKTLNMRAYQEYIILLPMHKRKKKLSVNIQSIINLRKKNLLMSKSELNIFKLTAITPWILKSLRMWLNLRESAKRFRSSALFSSSSLSLFELSLKICTNCLQKASLATNRN